MLLLRSNNMVNKNLIYLINAGNDPGMSAIANDYSFPALGVLSLGTWLKRQIPDLEVIVRDGGACSQDRIKEEIGKYNPGLVGVSVLSTSYQNSLDIAKASKDLGSKVVFGNDQAAQLSRSILKNRPYVDYVVGSEYGEEALEDLVRMDLLGENISPEQIPHLTYRENGEVKGFDFQKDKKLLSILRSRLNKGRGRKTGLDVYPIVDRTLYPQDHWDSYKQNYLSKFEGLHTTPVEGVSTMNRARGCSRQGNSICKHCDMLLDVSFSSPEMFWEEARAAYDQVRANVLYEVADSFSSFRDYVSRVARSRPKDLGFDPQFFVYSQARDIVASPELVEHYKKMGVFRTNIGLESGNDRTLKHLKGEEDSVEKNYQTLRLMKNNGIHVYGSLVLGSEAETRETLKATVDWAKRIIDERLVSDIEAQPFLPLPNNYAGQVLQKYSLFPKGKHDDWPIDCDAVSRAYIDNFSGVSYDECLDAAREIRSYAKENEINFGSGVSKERNYE